ncbi:transketolase [Glycomyces algeriensis]|uniref:Transketolase n=1 Tax=Glycomyces algeriensis TaxID=256037 RepID=A0A9W6LID8_9ACTN|nr:transketolase [Glycomyces algeriensis]MDA1365856.1 transketolase [Glycomyces algeriensis]MDR7351545.1 transketolase [Glycomyces algeriensis]GLI44265.1 transketolase [Glycomyces algeriensis]
MAQFEWTVLDQKAVDTARLLAADAVEKAGNGHPGTAMSLAPVAHTLFQKVMRHDPSAPDWEGRDRFVLSCGHSSLTLYVQLYLQGYGLELEDLQNLRQWGSLTPGHPEVGHTAGVETTTGPLGQGLATAVGMAMAARRERGLFDPEPAVGESLFDHHVYVIASDGDIEEGVTHEASAIAGVQELGNLVVVYDDNEISIEDDTKIALGEDVAKRYEAYGWHVQTVDWKSGDEYDEDPKALFEAIEKAKKVTDKPSLIRLKTIIGWPAPKKQNSYAAHGSALGAEEIAATKELLGFDPAVSFNVPDDVLEYTRGSIQRGQDLRSAWETDFNNWAAENPANHALHTRLWAGEFPEGFEDAFPVFEPSAKGVATRSASGKVLSALAPVLPELWGGSADLAGSNNTTMDGEPSFLPLSRQTKAYPGNPYGRTLHFGIREFAMGTILNGIKLHGPTRPYGGTFLVFSDYMRGAVRLAALMKTPVVYVWTHDSIGLGEDGPTHQPVEHLASLRAIPGLDVIRPGDANETAVVWKTLLGKTDRPAALALTRQNIPVWDRTKFASAEGAAKGAYTLLDTEGTPDVILMGSGSEVQLAVQAAEALAGEGVKARVVSVPSIEWFDEQDEDYRESVLPKAVKARVSVEAGIGLSWRDLVGDAGVSVSLEHFGASAPFEKLYEEFGITAAAVADAARSSIKKAQQ